MLLWSFNDKIGEATFKNGDRNFVVNLYQGNAFLIFVNEYKDENGKGVYQVWSFFADEGHAKNCLGLTKESDGNLYDEVNKLVKIRINKKKYAYTKKLVELLVRAFDEIEIEIYSE